MSAYPQWKLGLIDSAWFGSQYEGRPGRQEAKTIGFDSLDLFIGFDPARMTPAERRDYVAGIRSADMPINSLVCTCLGLSDFNPAVRSYHIERAKNVLDLAVEFSEARNLCFVPGEYMFQHRLLPAESEWKLVVDATQQVGRHAAERRLELAIELLPFDFAFIRTLDDMERFLDEVGLTNVKATVDISHFWLMRIPPAALRRLKGRIAQVHVSDCDGVNHGDLPPGRGNTPIGEYMSAIRDAGFTGAASVELEFPPDLSEMRDWVAEAYGSTLREMQAVGVH
ncbi:MAG TPA: sugar phosphate isomerase/epimerase family protein [Roseiarcus sp.]|jgi:D-psicose/D-tagatose/L-ribulose 3-epimerase|nr:sugar phosphate isomerase/epimerase family protein [Roseiarcus sp.]